MASRQTSAQPTNPGSAEIWLRKKLLQLHSKRQWHQLSHMQVCTLHYRPDALPVAQQTESKHWRKWLNKKKEKNSNIVTNLRLIRSVHSIPTTVEGRLHCTFLQHVFSFVALKITKKRYSTINEWQLFHFPRKCPLTE